MRLTITNGTSVPRLDANGEETEEIEDPEELINVDESPGTETTYTEAIDVTDSPILNRRRGTNAPTPQRGLQKKKARVDLTGNDEDLTSEEEIVFQSDAEDSQPPIQEPPEPIRHVTDANVPNMATTVAADPRPMQPAALNPLKSCRYAVQLLVPAHAEPVKKAADLLQDAFREIQRQAGRHIWLAAWHSQDDNLTCKRPSELPKGTTVKDRDLFTRLFDNYMVLTPDTEQRLYLKFHFVTPSPDTLQISLPDIGRNVEALEDRFGLKINPNPNPCQSSRVSTLGWGFGTVKSMDGEELTKAIRKTLKIPDHVALGVQWRTIADKSGRRYPWPKDKILPRPPQALHFDIDDSYVGTWYPKFAKLFKKNSKKKVNFMQIRLIPCFTTQLGKTLSDAMVENAFQMAQKQAHFVNSYTTRLTTSNILSLDTPIGEQQMTLRRYLMMKAPMIKVTERIFVTVDRAYRGNEHVLITTRRHADQALRTINTMIPECLSLYGPEAAKWFTQHGLMAYQDIRWDEKTKSTISTQDTVLQEILDEDFFGMGDIWKDTSSTAKTTQIEGIPEHLPQPTVRDILDARAQGGAHDDTSSFGGAFGRSHSGTTVAPHPAQAPTANTRTNRRVDFNPTDTVHPPPGDTDDLGSVSTLGTKATTGSTRRQLHLQVEANLALRNESIQMAAALERLEARLAAHGLNVDDDTTINTMTTQEPPSASGEPSSAGADSAGGKN